MKPICRAFNAGYDFVFELRHHPLPEGETILAKSFQTHGNSHVGVFDSALRAKLLQSEFAVWIVDVRSKTVRFEHHAFRHVCQPAVHGPAKNSEGDTATAEMRGDRKSVGTRADNYGFNHSLRNEPLYVVSVDCRGRRDPQMGSTSNAGPESGDCPDTPRGAVPCGTRPQTG